MSTRDERAASRRSRRAHSSRDRSWRPWVGRTIQLLLAAAVLYGLLPQLVDVWSQVPNLKKVGWFALASAAVLQLGSWWFSSELDHVMIPGSSRFATFTTSLATNAVSRVVPAAGGALGVGLSYRMWEASGIEAGPAAGAVASTTVVSLGTLFALPLVTVAGALVGAPAPRSLVWVAVGGVVAFVVLFAAGAVLLLDDRVVRVVARFVERAARLLRRPQITAARVEHERDQLRAVLGTHWRQAFVDSTAMWACDYLSLVAVLVALHTRPRLSVVLLAFTASKILAMVPITPGGLGIVEAGLTAMLTLAGIPARAALLGTLAYRLVSYWLSLPAGLIAWLVFRRRYPGIEQHADAAAPG